MRKITIEKAAELLHVHLPIIHEYIAKGVLASHIEQGIVYVDREDVLELSEHIAEEQKSLEAELQKLRRRETEVKQRLYEMAREKTSRQKIHKDCPFTKEEIDEFHAMLYSVKTSIHCCNAAPVRWVTGWQRTEQRNKIKQ